MYLDNIAAKIREHIPNERMPSGDVEELLRIYAVLLRAKGATVTYGDIHDAWAAWMVQQDQTHAALVAYEDLPADVQKEDRVFTKAVRSAAKECGQLEAS